MMALRKQRKRSVTRRSFDANTTYLGSVSLVICALNSSIVLNVLVFRYALSTKDARLPSRMDWARCRLGSIKPTTLSRGPSLCSNRKEWLRCRPSTSESRRICQEHSLPGAFFTTEHDVLKSS
jgi:hypothetical protein